MDTAQYRSTTYGSAATDPSGEWPHGYFMPGLIPRDLECAPDTVALVEKAQLALGRISGVVSTMAELDLVLAPSISREALSSSRIEGTQASLSEVIMQTGPPEAIADDNLREVYNYVRALRLGRALLDDLPITQRLILAVHEVLMAGVRGAEKYPGELRRSPVWLGDAGGHPSQARFIPPLPRVLPELLTDFENYVNRESDPSIVIACALMHYQFETIHPLLDGNGRVGRILIPLFLIREGLFQQPVFGVSHFIERHRSEYYERLQAVRERGDMDGWIQFFSRAVIEEATSATTRLTTLLALRERYREEARGERASLRSLADILFGMPVMTSRSVQDSLGVSQPTAAKLLADATRRGWVTPLAATGRGGKMRWFAHEIWGATSSEPPQELDN
jgi:Fic family protein